MACGKTSIPRNQLHAFAFKKELSESFDVTTAAAFVLIKLSNFRKTPQHEQAYL